MNEIDRAEAALRRGVLFALLGMVVFVSVVLLVVIGLGMPTGVAR